jgi:hypothetical protein
MTLTDHVPNGLDTTPEPKKRQRGPNRPADARPTGVTYLDHLYDNWFVTLDQRVVQVADADLVAELKAAITKGKGAGKGNDKKSTAQIRPTVVEFPES